MQDGGRAEHWTASLSVRLGALLSLALLPLGLISLWQTLQREQDFEERLALNLGALTEQAARREEVLIERAFGAATALSFLIARIQDDPQECQRVFRAFLRQNAEFSFAGYLPTSGKMTCSSAEGVQDFSDYPGFSELIAEPQRSVEANLNAPVSRTSVMIVNQPILTDAGFLGYISISIPHTSLQSRIETSGAGLPIEIVTFNAKGEVLSAGGDIATVEDRLPAGVPLADLVGRGTLRFSGTTKGGAPRAFATTPIVENAAYALGIWDTAQATAAERKLALSPAMFPVLMWLASLFLMLFAMEQLVGRHIRLLALRMRRFGQNRELPEGSTNVAMPNELRIIENEFLTLADAVVRDEAELLDMVHSREVLLKEVHHRVKNNLQLISSIMNMQMRRTASPMTQRVLQRLQQRVQSLATVHRNLYQSENLGAVRVDRLLADMIGQLVDVSQAPGIRIENRSELAPVTLYPDQVLPLTLLTAEAVTNAMKYLGAAPGENGWIKVRLSRDDQGEVTLDVVNSKGSVRATPEDIEEGTGLGTQLISAFARQLGGITETMEDDESYRLSISFTATEFDPEATP